MPSSNNTSSLRPSDYWQLTSVECLQIGQNLTNLLLIIPLINFFLSSFKIFAPGFPAHLLLSAWERSTSLGKTHSTLQPLYFQGPSPPLHILSLIIINGNHSLYTPALDTMITCFCFSALSFIPTQPNLLFGFFLISFFSNHWLSRFHFLSYQTRPCSITYSTLSLPTNNLSPCPLAKPSTAWDPTAGKELSFPFSAGSLEASHPFFSSSLNNPFSPSHR